MGELKGLKDILDVLGGLGFERVLRGPLLPGSGEGSAIGYAKGHGHIQKGGAVRPSE